MGSKSTMASKLLLNESKVRRQILERFKSIMDGVDMSLHESGSKVSQVYSNFGDLIKRVQQVGKAPSIQSEKKSAVSVVDPLMRLKANIVKLEDMHSRLQFMLGELEGLVKKN